MHIHCCIRGSVIDLLGCLSVRRTVWLKLLSQLARRQSAAHVDDILRRSTARRNVGARFRCCSRGIATDKSVRLSVRQPSGQISDDFDFRAVTSFHGISADGTDLVLRRRTVVGYVDLLSADRHHPRARNTSGTSSTTLRRQRGVTIERRRRQRI